MTFTSLHNDPYQTLAHKHRCPASGAACKQACRDEGVSVGAHPLMENFFYLGINISVVCDGRIEAGGFSGRRPATCEPPCLAIHLHAFHLDIY